MKKRIIITLLALMSIEIAKSQCISVELSIKWENGVHPFNKDSILSMPYLQITYRNTSNYNYYFPKVYYDPSGNPEFPVSSLIQYPAHIKPTLLESAKQHDTYTNERFNIKLGDEIFLIRGWLVKRDTVYKDEKHGMDEINDDLSVIYRWLDCLEEKRGDYMNTYLSVKDMKPRQLAKKLKEGFDFLEKCHSIKDMKPKQFVKRFKEEFVFLKSNKTYKETYNLSGLMLVKGIFTLYIGLEDLGSITYLEPSWEKGQPMFKHVDIDLPLQYNSFKLYKGPYHTNQVKVKFN
ncbi:hypothetical protein OAT16_05195 [Prolixibacteraceae bacterium]|nr:hypothetical protein [Prolixibacteraceae bacterium]